MEGRALPCVWYIWTKNSALVIPFRMGSILHGGVTFVRAVGDGWGWEEGVAAYARKAEGLST